LADPRLTVEEENEVAKAASRARIRERARAFQEVFGAWEKPTPHGERILEALLAKFGNPPGQHGLPPNVLDRTDRTDEYQTWRRLGHFDVMEYIRTQLEWKEPRE